MKILLINGSPNKDGCVNRALEEIADTFEKNDVESEILWLDKKAMQDCIACYECVEKGQCVYDDLVNETASRMDEFDGIIVGSPVYYSGPNGRVTSFLDRLMFSIDKTKIKGKLAASVVSCRRGGASAAFERLNQYFLMTNMNVVSSQYWNQVHGSTVSEVEKDLEGLQTMRTLAQNFIYLLKAQEAASKSGIEKPKYEDTIFTNFIR